MGASRRPGPLGVCLADASLPSSTRGPLGINEGPGSALLVTPDDTPGPVGMNDRSAESTGSNAPVTVLGTSNAGPAPSGVKRLAWGKKVSARFKERVIEIATDLGVEPDHLMAAMAFESGETFSPSVRNAAGSGAVGLIQFMPKTAEALGASTEKLAALSAEEQLGYVAKHFEDHKGRLKTLGDIYMAILWPRGIGKPDDWVLWDKTRAEADKRTAETEKRKAQDAPNTDPKNARKRDEQIRECDRRIRRAQLDIVTYQQNRGLDRNGDGKVTKAEAVAPVQAKLQKGLQPGNLG